MTAKTWHGGRKNWVRDVAVRTPDGYAAANTVDAVQFSILAITAILAILAIH